MSDILLSIGLMSGTSMDGIDAAILSTDGKQLIQSKGHVSLKYDHRYQTLLKAAEYAVYTCQGNIHQAKQYFPEALKQYLKNVLKIKTANIPYGQALLSVTFEEVVHESTWLHEQAVEKLLSTTGYSRHCIDIIAYHGQTVFHCPAKQMTVQLGDGQRLANQTGIFVINDFRSHDMRMGGQGAPLAPLYHQALVMRDHYCPAMVINCGGIANLTYITGPTDQDIMGFDTGPGNGLLDRYVCQATNGKEKMDQHGQYGLKGKTHQAILKKLFQKAVIKNNQNYIHLPPPKSLDINDLQLISDLDRLSREDACKTLAVFTAETIVDSLRHIEHMKADSNWILTGGGWHNPVILQALKTSVLQKMPTATLLHANAVQGWSSEAMEAEVFAYLAVRSLKGLPISLPRTTGVCQPVSGGRGYLPDQGLNHTRIHQWLKNKQ